MNNVGHLPGRHLPTPPSTPAGRILLPDTAKLYFGSICEVPVPHSPSCSITAIIELNFTAGSQTTSMLSPCVFRAIARPRLLSGSPLLRFPARQRPPARLFAGSPYYLQQKKPHNEKATMLATQTAKEPAAAPKDFLSEASLSAKGQRKADWGIIKEMSRYLWPKVCSCRGVHTDAEC